jgi:hypothetical protein
MIQMIKPIRIKCTGHVACMGEGKGTYRVLVGKLEVKRPLGGPRHRWEDNIKMDLKEVGWRAWTEFIWLRIGASGVALVNMIMNLWATKCREFLD